MDVRLPNGVLIRGVPEGTDKFTIMEHAIKGKLATPEDFGQESSNPTEGMGTGERLLAGYGQGTMRLARGLGNLVGMDNDRARENAKETDAPLLDTTAGTVGSVASEIVNTLPVGGGAGALTRTAAARLAPGATRGVRGALATRVAPAAVEGAAVGATLAEPGERTEGGALGAGLGGAMGAAGKLLGSAFRRSTLGLSDEAIELQKRTGTFIPLSHALKPGVGKQFYEAFIANMPGSGGVIRGQYKNALDDLRRYAGEQAHPPRANLVIDSKDSIRDVFTKLDDYWKSAYDDLGPVPIKLFSGTGGRTPWRVPQTVERAIKREMDDLYTPPKAGDQVTGADMITLKRVADELLESIPKDSALKAPLRAELTAFTQQIDDVLKANLNPTGKGKGRMAEIFNDYIEKKPFYENYQALQTAGWKAIGESGEFNPKQLVTSEAGRAGLTALKGGADDSLQETGRLAREALPNFPSRQGLFQTVAALGLGGSLAGGALAAGPVGAVAGPAMLMAAARPFASPRVQKLLSGQYDVLNRYARQLRRMGAAGRHAATVGASNAQR